MKDAGAGCLTALGPSRLCKEPLVDLGQPWTQTQRRECNSPAGSKVGRASLATGPAPQQAPHPRHFTALQPGRVSLGGGGLPLLVRPHPSTWKKGAGSQRTLCSPGLPRGWKKRLRVNRITGSESKADLSGVAADELRKGSPEGPFRSQSPLSRGETPIFSTCS